MGCGRRMRGDCSTSSSARAGRCCSGCDFSNDEFLDSGVFEREPRLLGAGTSMGSSRLALPARTVLRVARLGVATTGAFVFVTRGMMCGVGYRLSDKSAKLPAQCKGEYFQMFDSRERPSIHPSMLCQNATDRCDWLTLDHRQDKCRQSQTRRVNKRKRKGIPFVNLS